MNEATTKPCTAFNAHRIFAAGSFQEVSAKVRQALEQSPDPIFIYDDTSGHRIELDMRPGAAEILPAIEEPTDEIRGRGRPKLGVIAREVTLLPRHWDWLSIQPGGASVALRKLVEQARKTSGDSDRRRLAQEAAYRFMSAVAGDFPGFQEASRALFAYDRRRFSEQIAGWPEDVRDYAIKLAFADLDSSAAPAA